MQFASGLIDGPCRPSSTVAHPRHLSLSHSCAVERESHKLRGTEERRRSHGMIAPIWQDMTRALRERDGSRRSVGVLVIQFPANQGEDNRFYTHISRNLFATIEKDSFIKF